MATSDPFAGLRIPFVRAFAFGRAAAILGMMALSLAVGWQLYERTGSAWALGLVGLVEVIPVVVLMLPAGSVADRYARRNVAIFAHSLLALAAAGLWFASRLEAPLAVIYALLVLVGVSRAFASPSVGTILPQLLEPEQFANVNAWLATSFQLAAISGPAVGGFLIAWTGDAAWVYAAAAAGQLLFILALWSVPALPPPAPRERHDARELFAGLAFIRRNPVFLAAITLDLFAVLLGGAVALLPMVAKDVLGVGAGAMGWLRAAPSLGALLMALVTTHLPPWRRPGRTLLATVAGFGLATVGFGFSKSYWLSMLCLFLTGVFDEVSVVIRMTLEQILTPDALRGRVSAVHYVFIGFSNELGAFESGATAALFGLIPAIVSGGVGTLLVVALVARVWPQLAALGPLDTLRPLEVEPVESLEASSAP
ncbi:MAG TPA: MFS transporter [Thermoanaerobaculia bacterium]|nr:MFS transporter [Thermoanaerobaculia bacterium]